MSFELEFSNSFPLLYCKYLGTGNFCHFESSYYSETQNTMNGIIRLLVHLLFTHAVFKSNNYYFMVVFNAHIFELGINIQGLFSEIKYRV